MNIRDAMHKAAAHIERDPASYSFQQGNIAGDGPGCLIVWACRYAGITTGEIRERSSPIGFGYMDILDWFQSSNFARRHPGNGNYTLVATSGAVMLREFANHRFPAKSVQPTPNWSAMAAVRTVPDHADGMAVSP